MGDRSRHSPRTGAGWLAALALAGALLFCAGCGGTGRPAHTSASAGPVRIERVSRDRWSYARTRFHEMCAGCHTLAAAGARGPRFNLDHAHLNEELVRGIVLGGGPGMPSFASLISYREYEQLVKYVLAVAKHTTGDELWAWQIRLRREGERTRPPGWPPRSYLTQSRYNP